MDCKMGNVDFTPVSKLVSGTVHVDIGRCTCSALSPYAVSSFLLIDLVSIRA